MDTDYDYLIVGAGITGLTLAHNLANDGKKVLLIDKRDHIGGNCYDYRDKNGVLIQKYGPHIFHTPHKRAFDFLSKFTTWKPYKHKVVAFYRGKLYPVPINRDTVNLFYNKDFKNEVELKAFLDTKAKKLKKIRNSEDVVISRFGVELFDAFVKNYTKKAWDHYPDELDKSVLERLPIRYDTNPHYFNDGYQGMPSWGFTHLFRKMLRNQNITVKLNTDFFKKRWKAKNIIFTGKIDQFFGYRYGKLDYRCIKFVFRTRKKDFQEYCVVNYPDNDVKYTRITDFRRLFMLKTKRTVTCTEYPMWKGLPCYPVPNKANHALFKKYLALTKNVKNVYFAGRLATYRYINMDQAVLDALDLYDHLSKKQPIKEIPTQKYLTGK